MAPFSMFIFITCPVRVNVRQLHFNHVHRIMPLYILFSDLSRMCMAYIFHRCSQTIICFGDLFSSFLLLSCLLKLCFIFVCQSMVWLLANVTIYDLGSRWAWGPWWIYHSVMLPKFSGSAFSNTCVFKCVLKIILICFAFFCCGGGCWRC